MTDLRVVATTAVERVIAKLDSLFRFTRVDRIYFRTYSELLIAVAPELGGVYPKYVQELEESGLFNEINLSLKSAPNERVRGITLLKDGWWDALSFTYALVRCIKPSTIVETGVGIIGASSAVLLQALDRNGGGVLWSIDPDKFYNVWGAHVGQGIPVNLRNRHNLARGPSSAILPGLVRELGEVTIFLHDGLHTRSNMFREYETVWPFVTPGGFILSDDINNSAIDTFASGRSLEVAAVRRLRSQFGVLRRST